jgi:hypothetical protein
MDMTHVLLNKLTKIIPCKWTIKYTDDVLSNKRFHVIMGNQKSKPKTLNNGLAQGSVLVLVLFNVYISDLPETKSRKFAYTDDLGIVAKVSSLNTIETTLTEDLKSLEAYYKKWRLKPNSLKTVVSPFTLNNRESHRQLKVDSVVN